MKKHHIPSPGMPPGRRVTGRAQGRHTIDTYKLPRKLAEPAMCPDCGAVYHDGRWQWTELPPKQAHAELCTACHRIHDRYPAGVLTLKGPPVLEKQDEIIRIARNQEEAEKSEHAMNRIMDIEAEEPGTLTITTTDIHLPRRIGEVVQRAFHGNLEIKYDEENYFVRVDWHGGS